VLATLIDTEALMKVIGASFIAGVGVSISFALVILGVSRWSDQRGQGHVAVAVAYLVLAIAALGVFGAGIVYGIIVMASK
jgi:hypothetical protein